MTAPSALPTADAATQIAALRKLPRPALWVIAARLKTLSLSVAPVLAGTWAAAAAGTWRIDVLVGALLSAVAIQVGTNLWNDAADAARGVDTDKRLGPPRVTALGLLSAAAVRRAAVLAFAVAALSGVYLAAIGGAPILAIGIASLALGYLYSMGPLPLSMTPFGEVLVVAFFGVCAVAGTAYLHGAAVDGPLLGLGVVLGLPAAAVLLLNNHRDRRTDARAGRKTLAIVLGETGSRAAFAGLLAATVGGVAWQSTTGCLIGMAAIGGLSTAALALSLAMWRTPVSTALNRLLPKTALFQLAAVAALAAMRAGCGA